MLVDAQPRLTRRKKIKQISGIRNQDLSWKSKKSFLCWNGLQIITKSLAVSWNSSLTRARREVNSAEASAASVGFYGILWT